MPIHSAIIFEFKHTCGAMRRVKYKLKLKISVCWLELSKHRVKSKQNMDEFDWNVYNETKLFEAMVDHKPVGNKQLVKITKMKYNLTVLLFVGINKYFQMALIWNKLQDYLDISSDKIWAHLDTMYNMESLDDINSLPFPNEERDFYLPETEFASLKAKKEEKAEEKKTNVAKKSEVKDSGKQPNKEVKKEDKSLKATVEKKEEKQAGVSGAAQRRDSRDGKEVKMPVLLGKRGGAEPGSTRKGKTPGTVGAHRDELRSRLEARPSKRPTRGSMRPEESPGVPRKSQSPLTVTPPATGKRRRL